MRILLPVSNRYFYALALWLTVLFVFTLVSSARIAIVGAAISFGEVDNVNPAQTRSLDTKTNPADPTTECASAATVRWLPHSTVNISYVRGEFTKDEKAAFHRAISLWQKAQSEVKLGIFLEERGEVDNDAQPAASQIIVKRDYSMDSSQYGKIVASTRPDNYLDRAFILINGSLRKRSSLRKTMLHELGHAFGLRDCPNCGSGATVMNYFFQKSVLGINIGKAGRKISDKPTRCDIATVVNGYRQTEARQISKTSGADGPVDFPEAVRGGENMLAPYLTPKAAATIHQWAFTPNFIRTGANKFTRFGIAPYIESAGVENPFAIRFASFLKPASAKDDFASVTLPHQPAAQKDNNPPSPSFSASASGANALTRDPHFEAAPATEARAGSPGRDNQRVLTAAQKIEFESYIPTVLGNEALTMEALKDYTFRREVRIQTIDSQGRVSGEYQRVSDILFDDSGMRIERGLSLSKSTLRRLKVSPEYVEDFSGVQLKGFELSKRDHYRIEPFMSDKIDGIAMRVYRMTPLNLNAGRVKARVFYGYVWVDDKTGKIVRIGGCALPEGKQRFPLFETQRALIDGKYLFPVHTIADDYLVFSSHKVHVRMLITYSNYQRFESRVKVIDVDD